MANIVLRRAHALGREGARAAAQRVEEDLQSTFQMRTRWDGDVLAFERPGVSGVLEIGDGHVALTAELGWLFAGFKPRIEAHLQRDFERYFG